MKIGSFKLRATLVVASLFVCGGLAIGQKNADSRSAPPRLPGSPRLFQLKADNGVARVMLIGGGKGELGVVIFQDPGNVKIRIDQKTEFGGRVTTYSRVGGKTSLRHFAGSLFYKQKLPIPVIYDFDGKQIAGLGDGGSQEHELQAKAREAFKTLPPDFQAGLLNLYLYGENAGIDASLDLASETILTIVDDHPDTLKGYAVEVAKVEDENAIRDFQEQN